MTLPTKKLGEVLQNYETGVWGKGAKDPDAGFPVLRSVNFTNEGKIDWEDLAYRNIPNETASRLQLEEGDILLEKSGGSPNQPVGRVLYFENPPVSKPVLFGNFIERFVVRKDVILPKFLFLYLYKLHFMGHTQRIQTQTTGIRNLQLKRYLKIKIPLPPLEVQSQIVERLEAIRKAQELNDKQITLADELFQSLLYRKLDPKGRNWEVRRLKGLFVRQNETVIPAKDYPDKYFSYIGLENIESNSGTLVNFSKTIGENIKSNKFRFRKGDVLYGKLRPYLNKVWLADFNGICSTDIWVLRCKSDFVLPFILANILRSKEILKRASSFMTGSNLPRVSKEYFDSIKISVPPLETQRQIAKKLQAVQDYKKSLLAQKEKLQELFESTLDKAMTP